jgi:hypothetical protein
VHAEAFAFIARHATAEPVAVLDIGGRNINGTPRPLFPAADPYRVLDIAPGPDVDVVADATVWEPDREYDVILCAEVFEHTEAWPSIVDALLWSCRPGGLLILTMAGPGRAPHSAVDGGLLRPGEFYANVEPADLFDVLAGRWSDIEIEVLGADVRAVARRPQGR